MPRIGTPVAFQNDKEGSIIKGTWLMLDRHFVGKNEKRGRAVLFFIDWKPAQH